MTSSHRKDINVPSQTQYIRKVVSQLVNFVIGTANIDEDEFPLVLSEAVANAIIHGNKNDARKKVFARVSINTEMVVFKVADEGKGFDHKKLPDPTKVENLGKKHGRGLFFIRHFMDEVQFNKSGNEITMIKYRNCKNREITQ
ncbi:MAG: ATP-binding protein [bacterium]